MDYIAQEQGVDPLTVLNKQRKAAGMTELPPSPALEVVQNELSPTQQRLLNQFKTPERSARGLMGQSKYNPEIVPGGCLLYTSPSPRDRQKSRMPSSA